MHSSQETRRHAKAHYEATTQTRQQNDSTVLERCRRLHVSHDIWEVSYDTSDTPPHTLKRINFLVYHMSPRVQMTP